MAKKKNYVITALIICIALVIGVVLIFLCTKRSFVDNKNTNPGRPSSYVPENTNLSDAQFIVQTYLEQNPWGAVSVSNGMVTYHDSAVVPLVLLNSSGRISFQYPENLFKAREKYGRAASGLGFKIETKEAWESMAASTTLDEKCNDLGDLGDLDCFLWNWPQRHSLYQKAINNQAVFIFGYETLLVNQKVKIVNKIPWLIGVNLGINGGCSIDYISYLKDTEIHFYADVCDDKFFKTYHHEGLADGSHLKNQAVIDWANKILDDNATDFSTQIKQLAVEKIIKTIAIKE